MSIDTDKGLTRAMMDLLQSLVDGSEPGEATSRFLAEMIRRTDARGGFVAEVVENSHGVSELKLRSVSAPDGEWRRWAEVLVSEGVDGVVADAVRTRDVKHLEPTHGPGESGRATPGSSGSSDAGAWILPLVGREGVVAVVGLGLGPHGVTPEILAALRSLILIGTAIVMSLRAGRNVAEAEQLRLDLFELSTDMMCVAGLDGYFKAVNPAFTRILGYDEAELLARPFMQFVHPEDRDSTLNAMSQLIDDLPVYDFENRYVCKDGSIRWISWRSYPVPAQKLIHAIARDVTASRAEAERQRRLDARIQQAQKFESLGILAGGIAHDFNNLLLAILGNTDLALMSMAPAASGRDRIEDVVTIVHRAADLCRQMLAYAGRAAFTTEAVDLTRLVTDMAHLLRVTIPEGTELEQHCVDDLPLTLADPTQIRQIVLNLITNAADAVNGRESGTIVLRTGVVQPSAGSALEGEFDRPLRSGPYVFFEVADNGIGMDNATRDRMFDPFFSTKFTGRGLGLAAVLGIVKAHEGGIRVESEPGRGCVIRALFPVADASKLHSRPSATGGSRSRVAGVRILLVDDDDAVRTMTRRTLEAAGCQIKAAASGPEALTAFRANPQAFDLVMLDMTMPDMSGADVVDELRRVRDDVPLLLTSGHDRTDAVRGILASGGAAFLQKPYARDELMAVINEMTSRRP